MGELKYPNSCSELFIPTLQHSATPIHHTDSTPHARDIETGMRYESCPECPMQWNVCGFKFRGDNRHPASLALFAKVG